MKGAYMNVLSYHIERGLFPEIVPVKVDGLGYPVIIYLLLLFHNL
jgi:hypothetical protein